MFKGSIVALITPFRDGQVDEDALRKLVNWHVEQGTDGSSGKDRCFSTWKHCDLHDPGARVQGHRVYAMGLEFGGHICRETVKTCLSHAIPDVEKVGHAAKA